MKMVDLEESGKVNFTCNLKICGFREKFQDMFFVALEILNKKGFLGFSVRSIIIDLSSI